LLGYGRWIGSAAPPAHPQQAALITEKHLRARQAEN
jgi:hypothetical protein